VKEPFGDPGPVDAAAIPRVVLDADGLDRLELVLGGWLPSSALSAVAGIGGAREVVLCDAENTPLAAVTPGRSVHDLPDVRQLGDLPRGSGPHWDPGVRLGAAEVCERIGPEARDVVAIEVDALPTLSDEAVAVGTAESADAIVVLVGVGRGRTAEGGVGWAGLTRAA
jgi:hypothetical protein